MDKTVYLFETLISDLNNPRARYQVSTRDNDNDFPAVFQLSQLSP